MSASMVVAQPHASESADMSAPLACAQREVSPCATREAATYYSWTSKLYLP
jgi:hypothetical protein